MRKEILILVFTMIVAGNCFGGWERTYGEENLTKAVAIIQSSEGNYIVGGYTNSDDVNNYDIFVMKADTSGDTIWFRKYGGPESEMGCFITETFDGDYIVAGNSYSYGDGSRDIFILRLNTDGDTIWTKTYGGSGTEDAFSITSLSDCTYGITGATSSYGSGSFDMYILKLMGNGDTVWTKTYGGEYLDFASDLIETSDHNLLIVGVYSSYGLYGDQMYIMKLNPFGDTLWTKKYSDCTGRSIIETPDSGFYITGELFIGLDRDAYIYKVDSYGDTIWTKKYGGTDWDLGFDIFKLSDGNYGLCGYTYSYGEGLFDGWLLKIDLTGDTIWTRTYGESTSEYLYSGIPLEEGGCVLAGVFDYESWLGPDSTRMYEGNLYLVKTDSMGYSVLSIKESSIFHPDKLSLSAHPNPFNSAVTITIDAPVETQNLASLQIEIFDVNGRHIKTFRPAATSGTGPSGLEKGGTNSAPLHKGGQGGSYVWQPDESVGSGVYLVRATFGPSTDSVTETATKRVVYLK